MRLTWWGLGAGLFFAALFPFIDPVFSLLADNAQVAALAASAAIVMAAMWPVAGPLFVADGIFLGLFALLKIIASTASGSVVAVGLMLLTPLGDSLPGIWAALGAMMVARGLVFVFTYRSAVSVAVKS